MSKKVKIFAIVVLAIALLIGAITFFSNKSSSAAPTTAPISDGNPLSSSVPAGVVAGGTSQTTTDGTDFSALLSSITSITIDKSIFSNPSYLSLRDHPVVLGTDIVGRDNPFSPIGSDSGDPVAENANVEVQTLQPGKITDTSAEFGAQVTIHNTFPVTVVFEYGTNDTFGTQTNPQTLAKSGTMLVTVNGLNPLTNYAVRAIVLRGSTTTGNTVHFTTSKSKQ